MRFVKILESLGYADNSLIESVDLKIWKQVYLEKAKILKAGTSEVYSMTASTETVNGVHETETIKTHLNEVAY